MSRTVQNWCSISLTLTVIGDNLLRFHCTWDIFRQVSLSRMSDNRVIRLDRLLTVHPKCDCKKETKLGVVDIGLALRVSD